MNAVVEKLRASKGLGFGGASIGNLRSPVSEQEAFDCVLSAARADVAFLDTAPQYGLGLSEHRIGTALRMLGADVNRPLISTKVGLLLRSSFEAQTGHRFVDTLPFSISFDYTYDGIMRSVEDSLHRLGLNRVDVLYIHNINRERHEPDLLRRLFRTATTEGYQALSELKDAGVTAAIGIANNTPEMCCLFIDEIEVDIVMVANGMSLIDQSALDELIPKCVRSGIGVVAAAPFCSGILASNQPATSTFRNEPPTAEILERVHQIRSVCDEHGIPIQAAALQYPLKQKNAVAVATGFRAGSEIDESNRWIAHPISDEFWTHLYRDAGIRQPFT